MLRLFSYVVSPSLTIAVTVIEYSVPSSSPVRLYVGHISSGDTLSFIPCKSTSRLICMLHTGKNANNKAGKDVAVG